jgi:hypothetical protein
VQLIRHLTPELVWQERWMNHANRAVALEEAILCSQQPAETAARLSRVSGLPVEPDPAGGFLLRLPGAARAAGPFAPVMETRVRVLAEEALPAVLPGVAAPASPFMAGMVILDVVARSSVDSDQPSHHECLARRLTLPRCQAS